MGDDVPRTRDAPIVAGSNKSKQAQRIIFYLELMLLDCAALVIGAAIAITILGRWGSFGRELPSTLMLVPFYLFAATNAGAFSIHVLRSANVGIRKALGALTSTIVAMLIIAFLLKAPALLSRLQIGSEAGVAAVLLVLFRLAFKGHVRRITGGVLRDGLLIIDDQPVGTNVDGLYVVDASAIGLRPDLNDPAMLHLFGTLTHTLDRVVVKCPPERRLAWSSLMKGANIDGEIVAEQFGGIGALGLRRLGEMDTLLVARKPLSLNARAQKRMLDLLITVPLLIGLSPLLLLVAASVRLDSAGPVFFPQQRVGRGNRLFRVLKFRSMHHNQSDALGNQSTSREDKRVTRVGRFIRATSIDELPQLLNVLLGDMSLVGPRPHALGSTAGERLFWQVDETYWHRHQLKPGITGLAQVRGFRGATVESSDLINRLQADMEYIEGWDVWRDFVILINTVRVLVHRNAF